MFKMDRIIVLWFFISAQLLTEYKTHALQSVSNTTMNERINGFQNQSNRNVIINFKLIVKLVFFKVTVCC